MTYARAVLPSCAIGDATDRHVHSVAVGSAFKRGFLQHDGDHKR